MPDAGDRARAARIIARVRSYGVQVREIPGHENRGGTFVVVPNTVFDHHDASSRKSGEWGALGLITDGTARGIPGPLSNAQVARCLDGIPKIAWVADGTCSHAGLGGPTPARGLPLNNANSRAYGVEKANDGVGEPYTAAANYATNALFHAMAVECGVIPESMPFGHKEWTTRKSDPTYSMPDRRRQVGAFRPTGPTATPIQEDDMPYSPDEIARFASDGIANREITRDGDRPVYLWEILRGLYFGQKAESAALAALTKLVAEQNGLALEDVRRVVSEEIDAGLKVTLTVDGPDSA